MSRAAAWALAVAAVLLSGAGGAGPADAARAGGGAGGADADGALAAGRSLAGPAGRPAVLGPVRLRTSRVLVADRDRDGVVTLAEAVAYFELRFARMDLDGDDALGEDEFLKGAAAAVVAPAPAALLATGGRQRRSGFEAFDLDDDGRLSPEEFFLARMRSAAAAAGPEPRARRHQAAFAALDADGDGVVSRGEFMAAGAAHFAALDADGTGRVTVWEFRSGIAD